MKILLIRMMGLGDVASILIPAVKLFKARYPEAEARCSPMGQATT